MDLRGKSLGNAILGNPRYWGKGLEMIRRISEELLMWFTRKKGAASLIRYFEFS
jgi:hypothetical protein